MDGYKRLFYTHRRDLLVSIYSEGWQRNKLLFYTHRRDLLVSINSVKVGRGLDGWLQKIILYTQESFFSEYILCEGWQRFGWMATKDYLLHTGKIY